MSKCPVISPIGSFKNMFSLNQVSVFNFALILLIIYFDSIILDKNSIEN